MPIAALIKQGYVSWHLRCILKTVERIQSGHPPCSSMPKGTQILGVQFLAEPEIPPVWCCLFRVIDSFVERGVFKMIAVWSLISEKTGIINCPLLIKGILDIVRK